jgi:hypothetical protein
VNVHELRQDVVDLVLVDARADLLRGRHLWLLGLLEAPRGSWGSSRR